MCKSPSSLTASAPEEIKWSRLQQWQDHCVVFLGKTFYCHSVCSTLVQKWVPVNLILGMGVNHCDGQASHLGGRRRNSPDPSVLQKLKMGIGLMGQ